MPTAGVHQRRVSGQTVEQLTLSTGFLEVGRISLGGTISSSVNPGAGGLALTNSLQFTGTGVTNTALTLIQADASAGNMRQQVPLAKAWSVWVGTGQLLGIDTNGIYPGKGIIFSNSAGVANSAQTQIYPDAASGNLLINVPSTKSLSAYVAGNQIWGSDANGFKFSAGVRAIPQIKTTTYTATSTDYILLGNHAATPFTINLPAATGTGQIFFIKNINTANVTVDANASETIDGSLTQVLTTNQGIMIVDQATGLWSILCKI